MAKKSKEENIHFEQAMQQLEKLVISMEEGDLSLEDSLKTFEKGIQLTRHCQVALEEAEQKVKILSKTNPNAELETFDREC